MKYIKTFEHIQYEVGDYVKLKYIPIDIQYYSNIDNLDEYHIVEIIKKDEHYINNKLEIIYTFRILENNKKFSYNSMCINKKLTKEDIKIYNMTKNLKKFNL